TMEYVEVLILMLAEKDELIAAAKLETEALKLQETAWERFADAMVAAQTKMDKIFKTPGIVQMRQKVQALGEAWEYTKERVLRFGGALDAARLDELAFQVAELIEEFKELAGSRELSPEESKLLAFLEELGDKIFGLGGDAALFEERMKDEVTGSTLIFQDFFEDISRGFAQSIGDMILNAQSFGDFIKKLFKGTIRNVILKAFTGLFAFMQNQFFTPTKGGLKDIAGLAGLVAEKLQEIFGSGGVTETTVGASVDGMGEQFSETGPIVTEAEKGMSKLNKLFLGVGSAIAGYAAMATAGWKGAIIAIGSAIAAGWVAGGPIGAAVAGIGATIGALVGAFTTSAEEKFEALAQSVVRFYANLGTLSMDLAGKIAKSSESIGVFASRVLYMGEVIGELGITAENFSQYAGQLAQLFYDLDRGAISSSQATSILNDAFAMLIVKMRELGIVGDASIIRFLKEVRERGLEIPSVIAYIAEELASIAEGLEKLIGAHVPLFDLWEEKTKTIAAILKKAREENRALTQEELDLISQLRGEIDALVDGAGDLSA
ncbi:hypothetical protein LCGC14_2369600, partial [marine sediment metagenome]